MKVALVRNACTKVRVSCHLGGGPFSTSPFTGRVTERATSHSDKRDFLSYADSRVAVSAQTAAENIAVARNFRSGSQLRSDASSISGYLATE